MCTRVGTLSATELVVDFALNMLPDAMTRRSHVALDVAVVTKRIKCGIQTLYNNTFISAVRLE